jgi:hypothetical protein
VTGGRMLRETWSLGDVKDVEKLCRAVLDDLLRTSGAQWQPAEYDDRLAQLFEDVWVLWAEKFDPTRGLAFASYASWKLRNIAIDRFFRAALGRRQLERDTAGRVAVDEHGNPRYLPGGRALPAGSRSLAELDGGELEQALASGAGDLADHRSPDLVRVLADRSREAARHDAEVARLARTPKGVSKLLAELRAEIEAQMDAAA